MIFCKFEEGLQVTVSQRAKKSLPTSLGLLDFPVGQVDFILHFPDTGKQKFLGKFFFLKDFFTLVKMTFGLVHPGKGLPFGQAGKSEFLFTLNLHFVFSLQNVHSLSRLTERPDFYGNSSFGNY